MRIVFTGAGEVTLRTAENLIDKGHEVIIIEKDKGLIEELTQVMDCSFLQGDGSSPAILKEVSPETTDVLFNLTDSDQDNIIASVIGRSLGFKRVILSIVDPEFEDICQELGLEDVIIPSRTISRYLADMVTGQHVVELSTVIKDDARFFTFLAREDDAEEADALDLPDRARAVCLYRDGKFRLVESATRIESGDEVVVLTHRDNLEELRSRWEPRQYNGEQDD